MPCVRTPSRMAILFVILSLQIVTQAGVLAADKVTLELKWYHQFQFAGFYAAQEKGFFAEESLEVEINERDPSSSPVDQVIDGEAQFGVVDSSLILHRLQGKPVVVLCAIFQHSPLVLLTLAEANIYGPLELKGKRLMRQQGVDDAAITAMFHQEGMDDGDFSR